MSSQSYLFNPTERTLAAAGDGFSAPRLTTADRNALSLGVNGKGMMVYDTTLTTLCLWNGTAWEFVSDNPNTFINVKDYGATGDGVTNDSAAIQSAINYAEANGGNLIWFPAGTYFIGTTGLLVKYINISLWGAGGASVIKTSAAITVPALTYGDGSTVPRPGESMIHGISIDGNNSSNVNAHGIKFWCSLTTISNCFIKNCGGYGMYFFQSWSTWVQNNHVFGCNEGSIYIGQECNAFTCVANEFNWSNKHGIVLNGGHGIRLLNNQVEECQGYGLYVLGNGLSAIRNVLYQENYHERNGKNALYPHELYADRSGAEISNLFVSNNYMTNDLGGRQLFIANTNSSTVQFNTLVGVTFNPGFLGTASINQPIADTTVSDNGTYSSNLDYSPVEGVRIFGRLGGFGVGSQEGSPASFGYLFKIRGRYSASPFPTASWGNIDHTWGSAVPAAGARKLGDIQWNTSPASAGFIGWVCTAAGTPGTWRTFGLIS